MHLGMIEKLGKVGIGGQAGIGVDGYQIGHRCFRDHGTRHFISAADITLSVSDKQRLGSAQNRPSVPSTRRGCQKSYFFFLLRMLCIFVHGTTILAAAEAAYVHSRETSLPSLGRGVPQTS